LKNFTDKQKITGSTGYNRRLAQWRGEGRIEQSTSHQLLWCIDNFVLRNPPLRQAPKRYGLVSSNKPLKRNSSKKIKIENNSRECGKP